MRNRCTQFWSLVIVVKNGMASRLAGGIGLHCEYFRLLIYSLARVGIVGGEGLFMSTNAHFWVKIDFKFQSLDKITNISAADPPPILLGHSNTESSRALVVIVSSVV